MLVWLFTVITCLLTTHDRLVIGAGSQLQCPQVPATYGDDDLGLSSFSLLLDQSEGVGNGADGKSSEGRQCKSHTELVNLVL